MLERKTYEEYLNFLEVNYNKKYTKQQKDMMYLVFEKLDEKIFKACIIKTLETHMFNTLPNVADIYQHVKTTENTKILMSFKVQNYIRKMATMSSYNVACDMPIVHAVIEELGGLEYLGCTTLENLDIILNTKVEKLVKALADTKLYNLKLILGKGETDELYIYGDREQAKHWISSYIAKNTDLIETQKQVIKLLNKNNMLEDKVLQLENTIKLLGGGKN
ncbi:hypothetical protein [uncultured Sneathia sp.]|uniref:hypothetical protein n=1 Tax=uncultured Sneathia sp. TaxID=278067 RepID=UPI0025981C93|nr:hypothetical protein [uncultured Sneathia sp.]